MDGLGRNFHEQLARQHAVEGSSDRSFGLSFAAVCALVGLARLWSGGASAPYWLGAAAAFLGAALLAPAVLGPLNRVWLTFGLVLYRVVNPVVMALLFFVAVTPMAFIMRRFGQRPLQLDITPDATTYWVERRPPGPQPSTMNRQF